MKYKHRLLIFILYLILLYFIGISGWFGILSIVSPSFALLIVTIFMLTTSYILWRLLRLNSCPRCDSSDIKDFFRSYDVDECVCQGCGHKWPSGDYLK